ncbi:hypothetical protein Q3G72_033830 [Acer saccharum]|nr:hypothetical protein Q3G72_033830 [Acer saccharum]
MFLQGLSKVERVEIVGYKYPTSFWQIGVNSLEHIRSQRPSDLQFHLLMSFMEEERKELEQGLACRLQYLALRNCECLMKLQQLSNSLSFLRGISIEDCPKLVSIPETALPSELRFIVIKKCNALESLPMSWMHRSNTSLEILSIQSCDSLAYIAKVQLPPNLKKLEILYCSSLQTLVNEEEVALTHEENVDYLKNISCHQSRGNLPETLKHLYILGCSKLESIAESFYGNTSLETLKIEQCQSLEVLPNDLHNLSHLQQFSISNCLSLVPYPEWRLPSNKVEISSDLLGWLDPVYREDTTGFVIQSCEFCFHCKYCLLVYVWLSSKTVFSVLNPSRKKWAVVCCF